jgi:NAD(P)-dependent dehydrogenase (short-subunit alcohol dehydrogenase family)
METRLIALVTGGNSGIGKAVADLLTQKGINTIICARREEEGAKTVEAFSGRPGKIFFKRSDLSSSEQVQNLFSEIEQEFGGLDFAVNNAAVGGIASELHKYPEKVFDKVMSVNVKGLWNCMRYEIPLMLKKGSGSIVNVSSIAGLQGADWHVSPYSAAKHAVIGLTKSAALEYATKGIRVNAVCPGFIMTEMLEGLFQVSPDPDTAKKEIAAKHPVNRIALPEEVAQAIYFLLSQDSSFITGVAMPVDGGYSAR